MPSDKVGINSVVIENNSGQILTDRNIFFYPTYIGYVYTSSKEYTTLRNKRSRAVLKAFLGDEIFLPLELWPFYYCSCCPWDLSSPVILVAGIWRTTRNESRCNVTYRCDRPFLWYFKLFRPNLNHLVPFMRFFVSMLYLAHRYSNSSMYSCSSSSVLRRSSASRSNSRSFLLTSIGSSGSVVST